MTIRRWIALALVVALSLTLAPPASRAQIPMLSQGLVMTTVASVNAANTTTETLLFQYQIPAAMIASWTTNNTAFGAAPLHLRLNGTIRTNSTTGLGGNNSPATLGVNLGGVLASITLLNGLTLPDNLGKGSTDAGADQKLTPVAIDVIFAPIATLTTQSCVDLKPCAYSLFMNGRFSLSTPTGSNSVAATEVAVNAATLGQVNTQTSQTLNVVWRWASAASGNSLNIYNGVLKIGF